MVKYSLASSSHIATTMGSRHSVEYRDNPNTIKELDRLRDEQASLNSKYVELSVTLEHTKKRYQEIQEELSSERKRNDVIATNIIAAFKQHEETLKKANELQKMEEARQSSMKEGEGVLHKKASSNRPRSKEAGS